MEILISDKRTVRDIQKDFNKLFPFLKVEFFSAPHEVKKASSKQLMYSHDKKIAACRKQHNDGAINFSGTDTVSQLEEQFWKNFGLSAQVFRKSGNLWIETSLTDSWTLMRQNDEGREMSNPRQEEDLDLGDRDKWE